MSWLLSSLKTALVGETPLGYDFPLPLHFGEQMKADVNPKYVGYKNLFEDPIFSDIKTLLNERLYDVIDNYRKKIDAIQTLNVTTNVKFENDKIEKIMNSAQKNQDGVHQKYFPLSQKFAQLLYSFYNECLTKLKEKQFDYTKASITVGKYFYCMAFVHVILQNFKFVMSEAENKIFTLRKPNYGKDVIIFAFNWCKDEPLLQKSLQVMYNNYSSNAIDLSKLNLDIRHIKSLLKDKTAEEQPSVTTVRSVLEKLIVEEDLDDGNFKERLDVQKELGRALRQGVEALQLEEGMNKETIDLLEQTKSKGIEIEQIEKETERQVQTLQSQLDEQKELLKKQNLEAVTAAAEVGKRKTLEKERARLEAEAAEVARVAAETAAAEEKARATAAAAVAEAAAAAELAAEATAREQAEKETAEKIAGELAAKKKLEEERSAEAAKADEDRRKAIEDGLEITRTLKQVEADAAAAKENAAEQKKKKKNRQGQGQNQVTGNIAQIEARVKDLQNQQERSKELVERHKETKKLAREAAEKLSKEAQVLMQQQAAAEATAKEAAEATAKAAVAKAAAEATAKALAEAEAVKAERSKAAVAAEKAAREAAEKATEEKNKSEAEEKIRKEEHDIQEKIAALNEKVSKLKQDNLQQVSKSLSELHDSKVTLETILGKGKETLKKGAKSKKILVDYMPPEEGIGALSIYIIIELPGVKPGEKKIPHGYVPIGQPFVQDGKHVQAFTNRMRDLFSMLVGTMLLPVKPSLGELALPYVMDNLKKEKEEEEEDGGWAETKSGELIGS